MPHHVGDPAHRRGDDGAARGQRLQDDVGGSLGPARQREDVGGREPFGDLAERTAAGREDPTGAAAERVVADAPIADEREPRRREAGGGAARGQGLGGCHELAHALLRLEPADEEDDGHVERQAERAPCGGAIAGPEEVPVDAVGHEHRPLARGAELDEALGDGAADADRGDGAAEHAAEDRRDRPPRGDDVDVGAMRLHRVGQPEQAGQHRGPARVRIEERSEDDVEAPAQRGEMRRQPGEVEGRVERGEERASAGHVRQARVHDRQARDEVLSGDAPEPPRPGAVAEEGRAGEVRNARHDLDVAQARQGGELLPREGAGEGLGAVREDARDDEDAKPAVDGRRRAGGAQFEQSVRFRTQPPGRARTAQPPAPFRHHAAR